MAWRNKSVETVRIGIFFGFFLGRGDESEGGRRLSEEMGGA